MLKYYGLCEWIFSGRVSLLPAIVTVVRSVPASCDLAVAALGGRKALPERKPTHTDLFGLSLNIHSTPLVQ
jgi:hypothetical protein